MEKISFLFSSYFRWRFTWNVFHAGIILWIQENEMNSVILRAWADIKIDHILKYGQTRLHNFFISYFSVNI